jgi:hypothetical protein
MPGGQAYIVKAGDSIPKIAKAHGFRKWQTVWQDPGNEQLRKDRANPRVLHPGDTVMIPAKRRKDVPCGTEQHHVFQAPVMKELLRIVVEESRGVPMADKPYVLVVDGKEYTGKKTGPDGLLEEWIPVDSKEGELEIEGCVWPLEIGHLNPVDEDTTDQKVSGAQARLNNLGYDCGEVTGQMNEETREAIKAFQADEGKDQTGNLDDETCRLLRDRHGS